MSRKTKAKLEEAIVRAGRTFAQAAAATFLGMTLAGGQVGGVPDVNTLRAVGIASAWSGLIAVVSLVYNIARPRATPPAATG